MISLTEFYLSDKSKQTQMIIDSNTEIERLNKENNILKKNAEHNDKVVDNANWENMLLKKRMAETIEYIEYYFAKGRTKNNKQFDLSLYEILTGKDLSNLTMKEIEQFFKGADKE